MNRTTIALTFSLLVSPALTLTAMAQGASGAITEEAARAIGVDAYLYFYPLISVDITRKQSTNIEAGKEFGKGPMNTFVNVPAFPPADLKVVVRINFDTLYSIAWLDLTKEPQIVSAPDTNRRYYLLPMLDMWTDVFASPGWRTTGTEARNFLVTPPGWSGAVPEGFARISAPTPYVWIIGRTKTDGPADYDAVHKIQAGYMVTPLSRWGKGLEPVTVRIGPSVDMKTPPKIQVDTMPAAKYFTYAAELLKLQPPHITDQPIIAQMKRIGIEPASEAAEAWAATQNSTSIAVLQTFADRYGDTIYGRMARARIEELKRQGAAAPPAPSRVQTAEVAPPVRPNFPCASHPAAGVSLSSRAAKPLSGSEECALKPKDIFKECATCPEMVVLPAGRFTMGSPPNETGRSDHEGPQHIVTIAQPFAVGRLAVTVDQFAAFAADTRHDMGST